MAYSMLHGHKRKGVDGTTNKTTYMPAQKHDQYLNKRQRQVNTVECADFGTTLKAIPVLINGIQDTRHITHASYHGHGYAEAWWLLLTAT